MRDGSRRLSKAVRPGALGSWHLKSQHSETQAGEGSRGWAISRGAAGWTGLTLDWKWSPALEVKGHQQPGRVGAP